MDMHIGHERHQNERLAICESVENSDNGDQALEILEQVEFYKREAAMQGSNGWFGTETKSWDLVWGSESNDNEQDPRDAPRIFKLVSFYRKDSCRQALHEGARRKKLELHSNVPGHFLLCSVAP